jgi:nucleotide-binding universal stress UspA family protein
MSSAGGIRAQRFARIVHPTDFAAASEVAFAHALRVALAARGHLRIVHAEREPDAVDPERAAFPGVRGTLARWGLLAADAPRREVGDRLGLRVAKVAIAARELTRALARHARNDDCDLLVLATGAREGIARLVHGSFAEALARAARVPTLFLPAGARGFVDPATGEVRLRTILAPVGEHLPHGPAVALALDLADLLGCGDAVAHLLHVGAADAAPAVPVRPEHAARVRGRAGEGALVPAILDAAAALDADLILMTTRGHDSLPDRLRGSTTEQVLRHAGRALLAVPVV